MTEWKTLDLTPRKLTDSERIDRLTIAFDRLCDLLKRDHGGWLPVPHDTEIEMIRQYATGMLD